MNGGMAPLPRGLRNHNPLNLRDFGERWQGLDDPPRDRDGYCRFTSDVWGLRAGIRDLWKDWSIDGQTTLASLIAEFAPPLENHTEIYLGFVAGRVGVTPDDYFEFRDRDKLFKLIRAMVDMEIGGKNAHLVGNDDIRGAIALAQIPPPPERGTN